MGKTIKDYTKLLNNVLGHDMDKNGYVNTYLKYQSAIYIFYIFSYLLLQKKR
jgi:hypothetical protein